MWSDLLIKAAIFGTALTVLAVIAIFAVAALARFLERVDATAAADDYPHEHFHDWGPK